MRPFLDPSTGVTDSAVFQQFVTLKDFTMDFTLEDWEQLGLDQGDVFWDTALDNYQNLFLLSEYAPWPCSVIAHDSLSPTG